MKLSIFSNSTPKSKDAEATLRATIAQYTECGIVYDEQNPDIVIVIGGDGTQLSAFHHYESQLEHVRFVGIHTGHLGFYADWQVFEIEDLVKSLVHDPGTEVTYPLLNVTVHNAAGEEQTWLSLNEATIKYNFGTLAADVYLNDGFFESFRGDGLLVSTPTGSTAYNKAIGGAVIHPTLEAMQLTEIASANNRVYRTLGAPIVLSHEDKVRIVVDPQTTEPVISVDNIQIPMTDVEWIESHVATQKIRFVEYRHMNFWQRLQTSFIGSEEN
jgi:NAD+ kinase